MTALQVQAQTTVNLPAGWNLLGNSSSTSLDVATAFGDATKVATVWKWVPAKSRWAFYAPSLVGTQLPDYAMSKGYDVLTTIDSGEGFWVNARTSFGAQLPAGTSVTSASFRATLGAGWNLIASGDNKTPGQFNQALNTAPPPLGTTPANLITLWSWDAALTNWYFYAPGLEAAGGNTLGDYIGGKGYLNFGTKPLDPALGFWVNRSTPPATIVLGSTDAISASPMSILTLTGSGFDPTAMTSVRFFDADQYAVDVRPVRVSSTSIVVAVPPYFNVTSAVFAPGTVSVKVIQTSGAGTRSSAALAGFRILDLPVAAGAAGAVTLDFLQSLQANATALQSSAGAALGALAISSLADQASAIGLLANTVQLIVTDPSKRASLGTYQGVSLSLGAPELRQADRLLLGVFMALGSGSSEIASAGATAIANLGELPRDPAALQSNPFRTARNNAPVQLAFNGALEQLAIGILANTLLDRSQQGAATGALRNESIQLAQALTSGACMQAEANAYAQCKQTYGDAGVCDASPIVRAPRESLVCSIPGVFNTALTVVAAGLVAGVGVTALLFGASVGTVAGTAGVLALAGYLAYATVATGMVQIGIGGSLGQTSAGARQLVEGGLTQLHDFVRDTTISLGVGAAAGETAGYVNDAVTAAWNLYEVIPAQSTATTTSAATTSTTTVATTTTTSSTTTTTINPSNIVVFRGIATSTGTQSQPNEQYCSPNPVVATSTFTPITVELVFETTPLRPGPLSGFLYLGSTTQTVTAPAGTCVGHTETSAEWVMTFPARTYPARTLSGELPGYSIPITGLSDGTTIVIDPFGYDSETFTATVSAAPVTGIVQFLGQHVFTITNNASTVIVTRTYTLTWQ